MLVLWLPNVLAIHSDSVSYIRFSFPCLSNIFLLTCVTDGDIHEVKTITCEVVFQFKSNLNVFKGVVNIYHEIVAAFASFITAVNVSDKTSPYPALVKSFLKIGD